MKKYELSAQEIYKESQLSDEDLKDFPKEIIFSGPFSKTFLPSRIAPVFLGGDRGDRYPALRENRFFFLFFV